MPSESPRRKPNRAPGFDYREPGPYFVTACERRNRNRFGRVGESRMHLNEAGAMVARTWLSVAEKFPASTLESFVVMPNHFHALITFDSRDIENNPSLSDVLQWFKTMTTNRYIHGVRDSGWPRFDGQLWKRSFHERIVRTDAEMDRIRAYIENNPALWNKDTFYEP